MEKGNSPLQVLCVSFFTEQEEIRESNLKLPLTDAGLKNSGLEKRANKGLASKRNCFEIYDSKWIIMFNDVPTRLIKKNWASLPLLSLSLFFSSRTRAYYQETTSVERKTQANVTIYFFYMYIYIYAYF